MRNNTKIQRFIESQPCFQEQKQIISDLTESLKSTQKDEQPSQQILTDIKNQRKKLLKFNKDSLSFLNNLCERLVRDFLNSTTSNQTKTFTLKSFDREMFKSSFIYKLVCECDYYYSLEKFQEVVNQLDYLKKIKINTTKHNVTKLPDKLNTYNDILKYKKVVMSHFANIQNTAVNVDVSVMTQNIATITTSITEVSEQIKTFNSQLLALIHKQITVNQSEIDAEINDIKSKNITSQKELQQLKTQQSKLLSENQQYKQYSLEIADLKSQIRSLQTQLQSNNGKNKSATDVPEQIQQLNLTNMILNQQIKNKQDEKNSINNAKTLLTKQFYETPQIQALQLQITANKDKIIKLRNQNKKIPEDMTQDEQDTYDRLTAIVKQLKTDKHSLVQSKIAEVAKLSAFQQKQYNTTLQQFQQEQDIQFDQTIHYLFQLATQLYKQDDAYIQLQQLTKIYIKKYSNSKISNDCKILLTKIVSQFLVFILEKIRIYFNTKNNQITVNSLKHLVNLLIANPFKTDYTQQFEEFNSSV